MSDEVFTCGSLMLRRVDARMCMAIACNLLLGPDPSL